MDERSYYLPFSVFSGIGPMTFAKLLKRFGSAKAIWHAASKNDLETLLSAPLVAKFDSFRSQFSIVSYTKELLKKNVSFVTITDKEYPKLLQQIKNPPFVLYVKGKIHFNDVYHQQKIAVVGTRKMTQYGSDVTQFLTRELVLRGFTIVSGLAIGVDASAHQTAINEKGNTIAVLGCGVDCCYPRENQQLYSDILKNNGTIISEFAIGQKPAKGTFPARNRIVAGLSLGILVTEGAEDSGALITAEYTFKNNRPVFAVPGPITSQLSKGPYTLIKKGAKLVTKVEDILEELRVESTTNKKNSKSTTSIKGSTKEEQTIIELLQNEPLHFDEIVRRMQLNSSAIGSMLSIMEMKGLVKSLDGGAYVINF